MIPPNSSPELPLEATGSAQPGFGAPNSPETGANSKTSALDAVWPNIVSSLCRGLAHDYRNTLAGLALFSAFAANELEAHHPLSGAVSELQENTRLKSLQLAAISDLFRAKESRCVYLDLTKTLSETVPLVRMLVPAGTKITQVHDQAQIPVRMSVGSLRKLVLALAYLVKDLQQPPIEMEFSASRLTEFPPALRVLGASPKLPCACIQMTCSGIPRELAQSFGTEFLQALNSKPAAHELELTAPYLASLAVENHSALLLEISGRGQMRLGFACAEASLE